jgi:hypothetical protein
MILSRCHRSFPVFHADLPFIEFTNIDRVRLSEFADRLVGGKTRAQLQLLLVLRPCKDISLIAFGANLRLGFL